MRSFASCERAHFVFFKIFFEKITVFIWQFSKCGGVGNERGNQPSEMLQATKATYLRNVTDNITLTRSSLEIRIGMLLHIFADTYAHQRFSGVAGWENYASLISSSDNYTTADEGLREGRIFDVSISVGHMWVGTAPDET